MEFKYTVLNGKIIPKEKAVIPIDNKPYFFDFAVYSSLKVIQGKLFFPEYHVERLFESAELIELRHKFKTEEVVEWVNLLVKKNQISDAFLRMLLIGDSDTNENPELYIFPVTGITYIPSRFYSGGVKVITYKGERPIPKAKTKNLLQSFLALKEAKRQGAVEALLVDNDGNIREGTKSNFFAIKGNELIMPPKEKVLEGITKKILLELANRHFTMREQDIQLDNLMDYDEFFITSTLFNVLPISQIDNIKLKLTFEKTKYLQKLFKEYYKKNVLNG